MICVEAPSVPWQGSALNVLEENVSSGYLCKWLLMFNKLHSDGTCHPIPLPQRQHCPLCLLCCVSQLREKDTGNYHEFSIGRFLNFLYPLDKRSVCSLPSFPFNMSSGSFHNADPTWYFMSE